MKLLLTLDFPPEKGGIQRYLSGIVRHTYCESDRVIVGCGRRQRRAHPQGSAAIRRVWTPLSRWNKKFSFIPMLWHFVAMKLTIREPMEVYCGNVYAGCVPWIASFFMRTITYAVYTYGTELLALKKNTLKAWILRRVLKKARTLYALGSFTAVQLRDAGITTSVVIMPPRIDLPAADDIARVSAGKQGQPEETMYILCVGRLVRHKGHSVLIRALSLLPRAVQWRCIIAGDGPLRKDLTDLADENNISDRLILKTALADEALWEEYRRATLFVLPSLINEGAEGFGIVLLEAMAFGAPVIASNTGGIPEVLENGSCGILVQPGDVAALADAIMLIHSHKDLAARLSARARQRVKDCYAW